MLHLCCRWPRRWRKTGYVTILCFIFFSVYMLKSNHGFLGIRSRSSLKLPQLVIINSEDASLLRNSDPVIITAPAKSVFYKQQQAIYRLKQEGQLCVHPELDPFDAEISGFFKKIANKLQCTREQNIVYIYNSTFYITEEAEKKYKGVECRYVPVVSGDDDDSVLGKTLIPIRNGETIPTDFFIIWCKGKNKGMYQNVMSGIKPSEETLNRHLKLPLLKSSLGYDVLIFGFDSVSRMSWMRNLPKSYEYFVNVLGGTVLEEYNIVGDGTPQALLPILTGKTEMELPEARRGHPNGTQVDGHPWIWKRFKNIGYITQWTEDGAVVGTFQYRMLGFKNQPTDHYGRPFQLLAEREMYRRNRPYCLGSLPRHVNMINWFKETYRVYGKRPKFMFGFHSEYSHGSSSYLQWADDDLKEFLIFLHEKGYLDHTVLILMSDHGARFHDIRSTLQGKLEERLPFFSFRFPDSFHNKYPDAMKNMRTNARRLTTPFDIHETLLALVNFTGTAQGDIRKRGISLFKEIPKERTCKDADIEPHWCACLNWKPIRLDDNEVISAANALVNKMNSITEKFRGKCFKLELYNVTQAVVHSPNENVLKYKQSKDFDGREADLSDDMELNQIFYQVTIETKPGFGRFEGTVSRYIKENIYETDDRAISRINKYGNAPHCIMDTQPHLRPYCYCKERAPV